MRVLPGGCRWLGTKGFGITSARAGTSRSSMMGIYYCGRAEAGHTPILFHQFSTGASRLIVKVTDDLINGLTVSPDRKATLQPASRFRRGPDADRELPFKPCNARRDEEKGTEG